MKLFCITLTGADDSTDPHDLLAVSRDWPMIEWGILFSDTRSGRPRYPSRPWIQRLADATASASARGFSPRFAVHLCGATMRRFMAEISGPDCGTGTWLAPHGIDIETYRSLFARTQINFNARRDAWPVETLQILIDRWPELMGGAVITQQNEFNREVTDLLQNREQMRRAPVRAHQILHDASGGRGLAPDTWPRPVAGLLNGYAGGLHPDTLARSTADIASTVGDGHVWIDMESSLRDGDDRFDLATIRSMLRSFVPEAHSRGWLVATDNQAPS